MYFKEAFQKYFHQPLNVNNLQQRELYRGCAAPKGKRNVRKLCCFFFGFFFFFFFVKTKAPRRGECVCAIRCSNYKPGKDVYNLYTQLLPSDCRYDSIKTLHHESRRLASSAS